MTTIRIDKLVPSEGAAPAEDYDPISLAGFTAWEVGDQARASVIVPDTFVAGQDFLLRVQESTPSISSRHGWQVTTVLFRPGLHSTNQQSVSDMVVHEFEAPLVENQLTTRSFQITGSTAVGSVDGVAILPGDCLSVVLTRTPVTEAEDPAPVKVFGICLDVTLSLIASPDGSARLSAIRDAVRDLFNEAGGEFLSDDFILHSMNRCLEDLAQADYWRTESRIPSVSGAYQVDLLVEIPTFQALHQVRYGDGSCPMIPLSGYAEFDQMRNSARVTGRPEYYVVQNTTLFVWPPPDKYSDSGFWVYHSFMPAELTFSGVGSTLLVPKAHDQIFVYYVLKQAFLRDRHAPGADMKFQEYSALYDQQKRALLSQAEPPCLELRPQR